jgi:hypothetical protein
MIDMLKPKINKYEVTNTVPYHIDIIENFHQLLNKDGYLCIVEI